MNSINNDYKWFVSNNKKLFKKYGAKYLAIKNKKVIGVYDSVGEGVEITQQTEKLGTFIVQKCGKDESAYTFYISSLM